MNARAQSETIGVILLTAVVVITVGSAGAVVLAADGGGGDETVNADVSIEIVEDGVVVAHGGGDPVPLAEMRVIVETGNGTWRPAVNESGLQNGDSDGQFEAGERWIGERDLDPEALVSVRVIDAESRTLLAEARRYPTQGTSVTPTPAPAAVDASSPTVQVDSPDGGGAVLGGGELAVTWTASDNDTANDTGVESVDLQYSADDGTTWATIATNVANDGRHVVRVPRGSTQDARIRVRAIDGAGNVAFDRSDSTFTVDDDQPSITRLSPNASDPVEVRGIGSDGEDVDVTWNTTDATTSVDAVEIDIANATRRVDGTTGAANGSTSLTLDRNTTAGNYTVSARATDEVGNVRIVRQPDAIVVIEPKTKGFRSVSVGDLVSDSDDEEQTVSFTLDGELSAGETVTVNLSDAQMVEGGSGENQGNGQNNGEGNGKENNQGKGDEKSGRVTQIDYREASVDDPNAEFTSVNNTHAVLTFTADGAVTDGETVSFTIDNIATAKDYSGQHTAEFERSDATGNETAAFAVLKAGDRDISGTENEDVYSAGDVTVGEATVNGNVTAGGSVYLEEGGTVNGNVTADGVVKVKEDGTLNGDADAGGKVTVSEGGELGGDVVTDGGLDTAGPVNGNVTAENDVELQEGGTVNGDVTTNGSVRLKEGGTLNGNLTSAGTVTLNEGSELNGDLQADGTVTLGDSVNGNVTTSGDVTLNEGGTAENVDAEGDATVKEDGNVTGTLSTDGEVTLKQGANVIGDVNADGTASVAGSVGGNLTTTGDVTVRDGGNVTGDLTTNSDVQINDGGTVTGGLTSDGAVTINNGGTVDGDVDANGTVTFAGPIGGDLTTTDDVTVQDGGNVTGDLTTDGDVQINDGGTVTGNLTTDGTVTINDGGTVGGDVNVDSADDINCNEGATINGIDCDDYVDENY